MNRKTKQIMALIAAVFIITAVILAVLVRNSTPSGSGLIIESGGKTVAVRWEEIDRTTFTGEIVNGKGEVSNHEYRGMELYELLSAKGIEINADTKITAVSEDNYTAELTGAEVMTYGRVYAAVSCDQKMIESIGGSQGGQLVVYGDANAKRQVRYLIKIVIE